MYLYSEYSLACLMVYYHQAVRKSHTSLILIYFCTVLMIFQHSYENYRTRMFLLESDAFTALYLLTLLFTARDVRKLESVQMTSIFYLKIHDDSPPLIIARHSPSSSLLFWLLYG